MKINIDYLARLLLLSAGIQHKLKSENKLLSSSECELCYDLLVNDIGKIMDLPEEGTGGIKGGTGEDYGYCMDYAWTSLWELYEDPERRADIEEFKKVLIEIKSDADDFISQLTNNN